MKKISLVAIIICVVSLVMAKEVKYPVSSISPALCDNAYAVVRNHNEEITIVEGGKYHRKVNRVITILNENGQHLAGFSEYYDKSSKIANVVGAVYNAAGERVEKIGAEDITDMSAISGFSIYEDNRVKAAHPAYRTVPYTVEYTFETSQSEGFYYPTWDPVIDYNVPVEKSSFTVLTTQPDNFRYKELNFDSHVSFSKKDEAGNTNFTWIIQDYPAIQTEPFSPSYKEFMPLVLTAPSTFTFSGVKGDLSSWKAFGEFIDVLNKDRQVLPAESIAKVKQLIANCPDDRTKVKKLYEYMQSKTRYVSIQVGIGGYQPFPAETVDRLGYGDCKALSNYMKSLLDIAQIKSHYVLINAGSDAAPLVDEFSSSQFNHATLCVPLKQDTLWLECTSQISPLGFIGDFTDNRYALLIDGENSKIVKTKAYGLKDNVQSSYAEVNVSSDGNGIANIKTQFYGDYYNDKMQLIHIDTKDREKAIVNDLGIASFVLQSINVEEDKSEYPMITQSVKVLMHNQLTNMSNKALISLNSINRIERLPKTVTNRKISVDIRRPSRECDTICYVLPEGFTVDKFPAPIEVSSKFGQYKAHCTSNGNRLIYVRDFILYNGRYEATEYTDLRDFLSKIMVADQQKCLINRAM